MTLGLESAFKIVFGVSRVLGVAPIRFSDMPRVSKILVIYGGILLLLTSYVYGGEGAFLVAEWIKKRGDVNFTVKGSLMRLLEASVDYIIYVYAIVKSVPRTKFLLKIVNDLKKPFEQSRKSKDMPKERNTIYFCLIVITFIGFISRTVKHIVDDYNPDKDIICIEFGDTNDVDAIKRITHIYISYCNFVRELNACESVLIMAHVYKSAMHLIGSLILLAFSILSYFEYSSSQLWINRALYFSSMSIFYSMLLFLLVEPSYQANIEIKQTYLLVGKELNKALERNDVIEMSELRALLKQLRLNRPFYSGFGLCMLERPLLTTVQIIRSSEKEDKRIIAHLVIPAAVFIFMFRILKFIRDRNHFGEDLFRQAKLFLMILFIRCTIDLILLQFVVVALSINMLLLALYEDLRQLANNIQKIREMARTYVTYCGLVRELNDCDNILLLAQLFRLTMHLAGNLVAFLLFLSSHFTNLDLDARVFMICYNSFGMMFYGILMVLVVEPSYRAEIQLKKIKLLIDKTICHVLEKKAFEEFTELQILLRQLHLNKPVYKACCVFTLKRPFVITVFGGIATFLVLVFQSSPITLFY
ncbi:unnamed protein product [Leptosia nina]|uniref:Gustatory receptor n=1 Tax=Leptosia nina TaxID=320188 RepID=A0AAV1J094_9NEOP